MQTSRRQFMNAVGASALVSLAPTTPGFLLAAAKEGQAATSEKVLVVVQLTGGNDGLNTVVPYADPEYRRNRFTIAIGANQVQKINDELGFHPALTGFDQLLQDNRLAILQGVGYAQPNRSHFESMDLWHTAHRLSDSRPQGWLGRYMDSTKAMGGDLPGIHLGSDKQPLALRGLDTAVPSVQSLDGFRLQMGGDNALRKTIESLADARRPEDDELLGFLQRSTSAAMTTSRRIEAALGATKTAANYPNSNLAQKLQSVARLINAGAGTRIYYVTLDGFDTHSQQGPAHFSLLRQLGEATRAFMEDMAGQGQADRVLLMTISEFGRRVKENASAGTDHGAAAPLFLAGGSVKPGLHGKHPSLTDLADGDLKFHTDYRRVYATVLEGWLGCDSAKILGGKFPALDVIAG